MSTQEAFVFELKKEEQEVTIGEEKYILSELDGQDRDRYLNDIGSRVNTDGKSTTIKNFNGMQAFLVSLSLREVSTGKCVPIEVIQKWPARLIKRLYDIAKKLSALDEESEDKAKNG